jgi:HEAT repeat protein
MKHIWTLALALCAAGGLARAEDYTKAIDGLLAGLGAENVPDREKPQQQLQRMAVEAGRPGAEEERAALCTALAEKLAAANPVARAWMLRQLERIGRAECVGAVAAQLADHDELVRESARRALETNPAPEAGQALLKALTAAEKPAWRAALMNSLGSRGVSDPPVVQALLKAAADVDDDVRSAALMALAKLGEKSAGSMIGEALGKGSPRAQAVATDAYLLLAERLCEKGDKDSALPMYRKLWVKDQKGPIRCAALTGLGRAGGVAELNVIFEAMGDPDAQVRGAAVSALSLLSSKEAVQAMAEKLKSATPEMKTALLRALAAIGDKSVLAAFLAAAADADESVRLEALTGLGGLGNASAALVLAKVAASDTGRARDVSRQSLDRLTGKEVDAGLLALAQDPDAKVRAEALRSLGARRTAEALPVALKAAEDADAGVRAEAFRTLGALATADTTPALVNLLVKTREGNERDAAVAAAVAAARQIPDAGVQADPVVSAYANATAAGKTGLLAALGRLGGAKALEAIRAALKDADEKVKEAAVRGLCEWPDASAAPELLALAKGAANETHQVLALRGYIRVAGLPSERPAAETLKLYQSALEAAKRVEEKRMVLGGLGEVKDLAALNLLETFLADAALKEEAGAAAVKIAKDLARRQAVEVKAVMEKVLEVVKNKDTRRQAQEVLDGGRRKARK